MRLLRFGEIGAEKPGILDAQDNIRDLSGLLPDIGPAQLSPSSLAWIPLWASTRPSSSA